MLILEQEKKLFFFGILFIMAINSIKSSKPKMTSTDLISKLKNEKGVEFNIKSEKETIDYISKVNNYLRTASYRKNYRKNHQGKYINLDFAYQKRQIQQLEQTKT